MPGAEALASRRVPAGMVLSGRVCPTARHLPPVWSSSRAGRAAPRPPSLHSALSSRLGFHARPVRGHFRRRMWEAWGLHTPRSTLPPTPQPPHASVYPTGHGVYLARGDRERGRNWYTRQTRSSRDGEASVSKVSPARLRRRRTAERGP